MGITSSFRKAMRQIRKAFTPTKALRDGWDSISGKNAAYKMQERETQNIALQQKEALRIANESARAGSLALADTQQRQVQQDKMNSANTISLDVVQSAATDNANSLDELRKRKKGFEFSTPSSGVTL